MTKRFHLIEDIQSATFCRHTPAFALKERARRGAKADGIRYEATVQKRFEEKPWYLPSPWILYVVEGRPFWCQPDGINIDWQRGLITVVEIKLKHTAESQRQLRGVYEPVLRRMFSRPNWGFRLVEVVKWFDPDVKYPEAFHMCEDPFAYNSSAIGVHICRP